MKITVGLLISSCVIFTLATSSFPDTREVQDFIVHAYNIPVRDTFPGDLSDPYVVVKTSTGALLYKSGHYENKSNATFINVKFNWLPDQIYLIEIFDHDATTADESCGSIYLLGKNLVGNLHRLSNPSGGLVIFEWKFPTMPPTTIPETTTEQPKTTDTACETTCESTPSSTTEAPSPFQCPPLGLHYLPYPGNCTLYVVCVNGEPSIYRCPEGTLFDASNLVCEPEETAGCVEGLSAMQGNLKYKLNIAVPSIKAGLVYVPTKIYDDLSGVGHNV